MLCQTMPLVTSRSSAVAYGADTIFSGSTCAWSAAPARRGGRQRAGKSSLLRVLAGSWSRARGQIDRQRGLRSAHLPQDAPVPVAKTVSRR